MYTAPNRTRQTPQQTGSTTDTPTDTSPSRGSFIPAEVGSRDDFKPAATAAIPSEEKSSHPPRVTTAKVLAGLLVCGVVGAGSLLIPHLSAETSQPASPAVLLDSAAEPATTTLPSGITPELAEPPVFTETLETFRSTAETFLTADLAAMQLTYYRNGAPEFTLPILQAGAPNTWWDVPSGVYDVTNKVSQRHSAVGGVQQPWTLQMQQNFFIHGWPEDDAGEPISPQQNVGGIRLDTADAKALFHQTATGTPVLVHDPRPSVHAGAPLIPSVPGVSASHYLVADLDSGEILAANDRNTVVPIASITKLMTAVVAAETIDLDSTIRLSNTTHASSLVPRLRAGTEVSMYSLLRLLLVESSNEAADVIAEVVGRDTFITAMNRYAEKIGLSQTTFTDPSGLDNGNRSSAADLLHLLRYIAEHRSFILQLAANESLPQVSGSDQFGELTNFNRSDEIENFIAGKVGETRAAGQTSASLHRLLTGASERTIALIILGSDQRVADTQALLRYISQYYSD